MKLDRLLAITILLINRKRISARELADRFEVSLRTIYRDIDTINCAGIPVASFQGSNGGFGVMENYKIDRNILTSDDIFSILTALKGLNTTLEDIQISNTLEKIKALVPEYASGGKQGKGEHTIIDYNPWGWSRSQKQKMNVIRKAIEENRLITFCYTDSKSQSTSRTVEPMVLVFKGYGWYFYGYCRSREDYRLFRLSRVKDLYVENEKFTRREKSFEEIQTDMNQGEYVKAIRLVLKFKPAARSRVEDSFDEEQVRELDDGSLLVEVTFPEDEWVYGNILSYGNEIEVLEPEYLREIIREKAKKIWEKYE